MKTKTHFLIAAGLLAAASISHAQTTNYTTNPVIYLAGSTAFAPLDNAAVDAYANQNGYSLVATTGNTNVVKAKAALYARTNTPVPSGKNFKASIDYINIHQTGSEDGVESASSGGTIFKPFLSENTRGLGLPDASTNYPTLASVTITTSTVYQKNSQFFVNSKVAGGKAKALTEVTANNTARGIAVQAWAWSVGTNFPTNALNITAETAQALFQNGNVPLSYFTGNPSDSTNGVWLIGRDAAAGARLASQLQAGYGVLNTVRNYQITNYGGSIALALTPSATVLGINQPSGNGGYASASSQQAAATNILPLNVQVDLFGNGNYNQTPYTGTNYLIQYNGYANSVGITNANGPALYPLAYNGIAPSINGVISGAYTFWTYEHLYVTQTKAPTNALAIAQGIADYIWSKTTSQLTAAAGQGYLNIKDLNVNRTTDGGPVNRNQ
jgi:hypothetical protein